MMSTSELRARILLTLCLPSLVAAACGGTKAPDVPVVKAAADAGASVPLAVAEPPKEGPVCPQDHAPERVCGSPEGAKLQPYPFEACPPAATRLRTVLTARTVAHGTTRTTGPLLEAGFTFDADATEAEVKRELDGKTPLERGVYKTTLCCYVRCTPLEVAMAADPAPPRATHVRVCIPSPTSTSAPAPGHAACPNAVRLEGGMLGFAGGTDGECCYDRPGPACESGQILGPDGECRRIYRGRPLREDGVLRIAETTRRAGWAPATTSDVVRREVADAWARAAAAEHSSIAAFARLSLELLALSAPADLVRACHEAASQEIDHATRSYAIASRFGGTTVGPGPLPLSTEMRRPDLARLVTETFADGCVAETVAALEAEEARAATNDAEIEATLELIARDEASHAAFAFRLVAWALREGGAETRAALQAGIAAAEAELAGREPAGGVHVSSGIVDERSLAVIRVRALRDVVLPCARALLAA